MIPFHTLRPCSVDNLVVYSRRKIAGIHLQLKTRNNQHIRNNNITFKYSSKIGIQWLPFTKLQHSQVFHYHQFHG